MYQVKIIEGIKSATIFYNPFKNTGENKNCTVERHSYASLSRKETKSVGIARTTLTYTVMTLSLQSDGSWQKVQTQIRLLLEEQSDHGLHCLPIHLHH